MEGLSRKEQQLSDALLDLGEDAMVLEELDGFVAGILVSPEMIPPSDWLPLVWNSEGGSDPIGGAATYHVPQRLEIARSAKQVCGTAQL